MISNPTAFISYSHFDKAFVIDLYHDLRSNGIDAWIDKFEINPGDSLIKKIHSEGLAKSTFVLVILSKESVKSKWVQEELEIAITYKMTGDKHIIPLLKEDCEIPVSLRNLLYIDLAKNYKEGIKTLLKTLHGVSERPPVGQPPGYVSSLKHSVGGLSKEASTLASLLITTEKDEEGYEPELSSHDLVNILSDFSSEEISDAVEELEEYGLVEFHKVMGNPPFSFNSIKATYALFLHFKDEGLSYNPEEDIKQVASLTVAKNEIRGSDVKETLGLSPGRVNRAADYLDNHGLARIEKRMGTAPYNFSTIESTRHTKNFVRDNS